MDVARGRAISSCNVFFNSTGGRVVIYLPTTVHFNNVHPKKSTHKAWKMLIFLICIWFNSPLFLPMLNLSCVYNLRVFSSTWSDLVMPVAAFNVLCAVCTMLRLFSIHFHTKHSMLFMQDWYMAEMYAVYPPHPTPPLLALPPTGFVMMSVFHGCGFENEVILLQGFFCLFCFLK